MDIATRGAWRAAAENRWTFRNLDAIVPTAIVANDPGDIAAFVPGPAWTPNLLDRRLLKLTRTDALIVLVDGKLACEYYDGGNAPGARHILMSSTKAVSGLLLAMLAADGLVDIDAPVLRYVPQIRGTRYESATLRELTDMRAGVSLDPAEERAYATATNWEPASLTPPDAHLKAFFPTLSGHAPEHGAAFAYVSANTDLMGWAVENATGRTFAELVSEKLWRPMGAEFPAYVTLDQAGLARWSGGLCVAARDFARLGQLILANGMRGDRRIIDASIVDDLRSGADEAAWAHGEWGGTFGFISKHMGCRNGWYAVKDKPERLFAMGIHGQNLFIDRDTRTVIAKLSAWKAPNDPLAFFATHRVLLPRGRRFKVDA